jgi:hypothetical protein
MENIEQYIEDAKKIIRWSMGKPQYYRDENKITWFPSATNTGNLNTALLRTVAIPADGTGGNCIVYAANVQPIHRGLAGMVLAETSPADERVARGIRLAKLAEQLEELFPQLTTRSSLGDDELEFVIDPLERGYLELVEPCLDLSTIRYISFYCGAGHMIVRDITPEEMGAFLWKNSKTG